MALNGTAKFFFCLNFLMNPKYLSEFYYQLFQIFRGQVISYSEEQALINNHLCGHYEQISSKSYKEVMQQVPPRATLLRLHPSHESLRGKRPPKVAALVFLEQPTPWCDGRCVQGPGTYSPRHSDTRLLAIPTSWSQLQTPIRTTTHFPSDSLTFAGFAALCMRHCSTCVALHVRAMMTDIVPTLLRFITGSISSVLSITC